MVNSEVLLMLDLHIQSDLLEILLILERRLGVCLEVRVTLYRVNVISITKIPFYDIYLPLKIYFFEKKFYVIFNVKKMHLTYAESYTSCIYKSLYVWTDLTWYKWLT